MTRCLFLLVISILVCTHPVEAQQVGYFNEVPVPTAPDTLDLTPGQHFPGKQVFVRKGQQGISFDFGRFVPFIQISIAGGAPQVVYNTTGTRFFAWPRPLPAPLQELGAKQVRIIIGGLPVYAIEVVVVPGADRAFVSTEANTPRPPYGTLGTLTHTILVWQGGPDSIDKPLLVVEGIDASNENSPGAYYALGATRDARLFPRGQAEGADIAILDFGDGGRRMQANAAVVRRAIEAMRQYSTNRSRSLDVIGVSMGGVVARYALAQMEQEGVLYGVGTFMSVDAPQQGAVIQRDLQQIIRQYLESPDWPRGLAGPAGRQLLQENVFDTSSPSEHQRFYAELNALNGGRGYPTLTTNVGVSFGASSPNPSPGQRWGRLDLDHILAPIAMGGWDFNVGNGSAGPGSYLPLNATRVMGSLRVGVPGTNVPEVYPVSYFFGRYEPAHPTFIPYASALDIVNGTSRFDGAPIALLPYARPSFHDIVPEALVTPMLNRLGYEVPAPTSVAITGPSTLLVGEHGTWHASVPGSGTSYQYNWQYRIFLPSCGGVLLNRDLSEGGISTDEDALSAPPRGGGGVPVPPVPNLITCGLWHDGYGSSEAFTYSVSTSLRLELRVTATAAGGSVTSPVTSVCVGACGGGSYDLRASTGAAEGEASAKASTTQAGALGRLVTAIDVVQPNPVSVGSRASVAFTVAEPGPVAVRVFDVLGREVARLVDAPTEAGTHVAWFDASSLPAGTYVVRLESGGGAAARLITVTR